MIPSRTLRLTLLFSLVVPFAAQAQTKTETESEKITVAKTEKNSGDVKSSSVEDETAKVEAAQAASETKSEKTTAAKTKANSGDDKTSTGDAETVKADASQAKDAPVQSGVRPFGLAIADNVKLAGSDAASAAFMSGVMPVISNLINFNLRETVPVSNASARMLDPSQLRFATDSSVRIYFVGEGAGYHNSLAFNFYAPGMNTSAQAASRNVITENSKLIFPDASSAVSSYDPASKAVRTLTNPLLPGDFVDLGKFSAGGRLDLALIANGANGGKDVFVASPARNDDHLTHVISFALKNSPYLIAAFEDLRGGGDRDYNDVIVAIDIGRANVARMVSGPTPPLAATLAAFLGLAAFWRRRLASA
jgi:hypothetical protein